MSHGSYKKHQNKVRVLSRGLFVNYHMSIIKGVEIGLRFLWWNQFFVATWQS
jgi:cytoskeletal protein RodZ